MNFKFLKRKKNKLVISSVLAVVALILVLAVLINQYWSPVLAGKIREVVLKGTDSLYNVDFSDAELRVLHGSITLYDITLKPDTAVFNRKKANGLAPNNLIELHIKKLTLSHIHPFTLYFRRKLEIGEVIVYNPDLKITYQLNHKKDTTTKDFRTPWQRISRTLRSVHVKSILMGDVKFRYEDYSGHKLAISEFKEMNLSARELLIDSTTQKDRSRLLFCKDIVGEINNYTAKTRNGLYTYNIRSLKLSTQKSKLNILGLTLSPVKTDVFFVKSHSDRFSLSLDSLQLNHFDFLNYDKYRILDATSLQLSGGSLQVFANPNPNQSKITRDKIKTFPHVAFDSLSDDINIDTINFKELDIVYNELNVKSKKTGTISFNHTDGRLLNLTNNAIALKKNNITLLQVNSYFMNRSKLNAVFRFNLTDKNDAFTYKGSLGPMSLQKLNPAVMPLAMFKVNNGRLNRLEFDIKANRFSSVGKIMMLYNDLKITVLQADTVNDKLKRKMIASLFANIFILKHNNPDAPGKPPRMFQVNYTRKPETPFFASIWQTLLSGIKPAVGLDEKTERSTRQMILDRAKNKRERTKRRVDRRKSRAEQQRKKQKIAAAHR